MQWKKQYAVQSEESEIRARPCDRPCKKQNAREDPRAQQDETRISTSHISHARASAATRYSHYSTRHPAREHFCDEAKTWMPGTRPGMTACHSVTGTRSRTGRASFFTAFEATMVRLPA